MEPEYDTDGPIYKTGSQTEKTCSAHKTNGQQGPTVQHT